MEFSCQPLSLCLNFRAVIDLTSVEGERTHSLNCEFQQMGSGYLSLLITISGTTASETISDLSTHQSDTHSMEVKVIKQRYVNNIYNPYAFCRLHIFLNNFACYTEFMENS